jgi:multidrug efflux system outer membrane protein
VSLSDLFTGPSRIWQFGPTVTVPIFNAGRNRANPQFVEAQQRESLLRYEQAIQQAFREVEDALVAYRRAREALTEQDAAVLASREALAIAELRYTSGLTGYLNVLDAQRTLFAAELAQSRTLGTQLVARSCSSTGPSGAAGPWTRPPLPFSKPAAGGKGRS